MNRTREFIVETTSEADSEKLLKAFPGGKRTAKRTVTFSEADTQMNDVYRFIAQSSMMTEKVERREADLEGLFMEVIGK